MNFESLFIQPVASHLTLNSLAIIMCQVIFIVSLGLTLGAVSFSLLYAKMAANHNEGYVKRFSQDIMNYLFINKWAAFGLGTLSLTSITLLRGSYLYGSNTQAFAYLVFAFVFIAFGYSFAGGYFSYNRMNQLKEKYNDHQDDHIVVGSQISGWISVVLILIGLFYYVAAEELASNESVWSKSTEIYAVMANSVVWAKYFLLVFLAYATASIAALFRFFNDQTIELDDEYANVVKRRTIGLALNFIVLLPLFALWEIYMQPEYRISYTAILCKLGAVIGIYATLQMLWALKNGSKTRFDKLAFPLFILVIFTYAVSDDASFRYGARSHIAKIELADYTRSAHHGESKEAQNSDHTKESSESTTSAPKTEH